MAGEVFQWTSSTFDATKQKIIIRGGSWLSPNSDELKSTSRFAMPAGGSSIIGFRVVRNIPPQPKISPINIDLVPVVDPNNPPDKTKQKHGTVATAYQIGKYDVTAEQYCMFLNAMASHSDPHELYDPRMETDPDIACVIRYGDTNRGYSYFTIPGREKFPITYVSSFSVMRFCNWLEHHQPTAEESPEATESGSFIKNDDNKFYPVVGAKWSIPTENQWYKAAYYYPTQNRYFTYGTGTDDAPSNDLNGANSLPSANYRYLGNFTIEMQPHLTPVGTFTKSASFYGALDMSGNVSQWTLTAESEKSANLIIRGGSWNSSDENDINFSRYGALDPSSRNSTTGFRLVYNVVPPSPKPLTTWEQITHGAEVIGKEMQEDVIGFLKGEIFTKPGTYFFQTMNYTIGVGISELLAKIINNFFFILDSIFKTIGGWISWCFGDSWYGGWTTRIYDMLFSPISAVRNGAAAAEGLGGAETVVAVAAAETTGAVATAEAAALASFFASPAAAVIIPVVLFAGAYEAFLATTKSPHDDSSPDDPRISVGLALDATVRYLWTAVRLLL
jgi:formylglycine-generating enzyme required for sulfatase activity